MPQGSKSLLHMSGVTISILGQEYSSIQLAISVFRSEDRKEHSTSVTARLPMDTGHPLGTAGLGVVEQGH